MNLFLLIHNNIIGVEGSGRRLVASWRLLHIQLGLYNSLCILLIVQTLSVDPRSGHFLLEKLAWTPPPPFKVAWQCPSSSLFSIQLHNLCLDYKCGDITSVTFGYGWNWIFGSG